MTTALDVLDHAVAMASRSAPYSGPYDPSIGGAGWSKILNRAMIRSFNAFGILVLLCASILLGATGHHDWGYVALALMFDLVIATAQVVEEKLPFFSGHGDHRGFASSVWVLAIFALIATSIAWLVSKQGLDGPRDGELIQWAMRLGQPLVIAIFLSTTRQLMGPDEDDRDPLSGARLLDRSPWLKWRPSNGR